MEGLIRPLVYALADSLGMELFVDKTTGAVTGEVTRDVNVGGLRLSVPMKVVSSNLAKGGVYMLIVKVIGNMAVFAVAKKVGRAGSRRPAYPEHSQDAEAVRFPGKDAERLGKRCAEVAAARNSSELRQGVQDPLGAGCIMLTFYTSSDQPMVERTFGRSLRSFRPNIPPHQFKTHQAESPPPKPEAGSVVLVCGVQCYAELQRIGLAPKNRTVSSMRETPIPCNGGWYLMTFDPSAIDAEPEKREIIDWDVRLAHRLMTTGTLKPKVGNYVWVADYVQLIAEIEAEYEKTGKPVKVSFDSETMGLYPWYKEKDFVCLSFTHKPGVSQLLYLGPQSRSDRAWPQYPLADRMAAHDAQNPHADGERQV